VNTGTFLLIPLAILYALALAGLWLAPI